MQMKKAGKVVGVILAGVLVLACLSAAIMCGKSTKAAKKPKISKKSVTLKVRETTQLKVKNYKGKIKWKSNKKKVAVVDKKGKVTAKKTGKAKITAVAGKKKLVCIVKVKKLSGIRGRREHLIIPDEKKNEEDKAAMKNLLAAMIAAGLPVSDDLDSEDYFWNEEGELVAISWEEKELVGDIDFSTLVHLEELDLYDNEGLSSINVTGLTRLTYLDCSGCDMNSLEIGSCTALTELNCANNNITQLNVKNCIGLEELDCSGNELIELDVSGFTALKVLYCENNMLETLKVTGCSSLATLDCRNNMLAGVDITGCSVLKDYNHDAFDGSDEDAGIEIPDDED